MKDITITLTSSGLDAGPFDIYSDVDNYTTPLVTNISKVILLSGYVLSVDDSTQFIRLMNNSSNTLCTTQITKEIQIV